MSKINQQKTMLELALQISNEFGFSVFPCREKTQGNKKAKSPYTNRGYKDASSDVEQIRSWWHSFPNAMIGVPTGSRTASLLLISTLAQIRTVKPRSMNSE